MRIITLLLATLISISVATGCAQHEGDDDACRYCPDTVINIHSDNQYAFIPVVPESMTFAGQKIKFCDEDMMERMDREMLSFATSHQVSILILKKAPRLLGEMRQILREEGVPEDMVYLAVIESNLLQSARSGVGAAGYWQFMEATAKQYGLSITETVDERYDVTKSTHAACRYMKDAYSRFHDWIAVAASYNAGMGGIGSKLKSQRCGVFDLWMSNETSRYIFRLLAAKILVEHPEQLGYVVPANQVYKKIDYRTIPVSTSIPDLNEWAQQHGATYRQLKSANMWLRSTRLENRGGKTYLIRLPNSATRQ